MKNFKLKFVGSPDSFIPSLGANEDWQGTDEKEANMRMETGMWVLEPEEVSKPNNKKLAKNKEFESESPKSDTL